MIPTEPNREARTSHDRFTSASRKRIECGIGRLKNARRVTTHSDKTATSNLGLVQRG